MPKTSRLRTGSSIRQSQQSANFILPEGSVTTDQLSDGVIQDLLAAFVPTGSIEPWLFNTIKTGWIELSGQTIGSPDSGADYAGDDALDLFTLFWTDYDNTALPILDSAGASSSRGASAALDWAANKRLPVYNTRALVPRGISTQSINTRTKTGPSLGEKQEDSIQGHEHHVVNSTETDDITWTAGQALGQRSSVTTAAANAYHLAWLNNAADKGCSSGPIDDGANGSPRTGTETRISSFGVKWIIKL